MGSSIFDVRDHSDNLLNMSESTHLSPLAAIDEELRRLIVNGDSLDSNLNISHIFDCIDETTIPYLSESAAISGKLPAHCVVRFRCLVQDILDPEYYSSMFKRPSGELLFTKYRDRAAAVPFSQDIEAMNDELEDLGIIGERLPLVCVPVPGESEWIDKYTTANTSNSLSGNIVRYDCNKISRKRRAGSDRITGNRPPCCILKVYDIEDAQTPHLNDMLEVIGIYNSDNSHELLQNMGKWHRDGNIEYAADLEGKLMEEDEDFDLDFPPEVLQENRYPAKKFPRIHCIRFRTLPTHFPITIPSFHEGISAFSTYNSVVSFIQDMFLGDRLAAEYLTLALVSRPELNSAKNSLADVNLFGNLNVNLYNAKCPSLKSCMSSLFKSIIPRSTVVDITIDYLNSNPLFLCKNIAGGKTEQSPLQVAGGTLVILDETNMSEGGLNECGIKNMKTLQGFLNDQQLLVDCGYYNVNVPADAAVVTLSNAPSLLSTSATIHVNIENSSTIEDLISNKSDTMIDNVDAVREWWAICRSIPKPSMDSLVIEAVERDFLEARARQTDTDCVSSSNLHRWILTAHLLAVAEHSSVVSLKHWEKVQALESELKRRRCCGD